MNFRLLSPARNQVPPVVSPRAAAGAFDRRMARHATAAMPAYRAVPPGAAHSAYRSDALSVACRTLAHAPAAEMAAISVSTIVERDAEGVAALRALVDDLTDAYGFNAEVGVDSGSFTVRFSRG